MVSKLKPDSGFSDMVTLQVPHVQFSAGQPFPLYIHVPCWQTTAVLQCCQPFKASPGYKKNIQSTFLVDPPSTARSKVLCVDLSLGFQQPRFALGKPKRG